MSDINPAEQERTVLHDLNELAFAMSEGRDPNLDTAELDRIGTFLDVMGQAVSVVRGFREEREEVEERYSFALSGIANGVSELGADSAQLDGGDLSDSSADLITDKDISAVDASADVVEVQEPADEHKDTMDENSVAAGIEESEDQNAAADNDVEVETKSKHAGSRAVDWEAVEAVILEVINGKKVGSELKQADFLAHPYFADMIDAADGNNARAKGQALRAARNVAERGALTHNGKIKAASRWIVSAEIEAPNQEDSDQAFLA